MKIIFSYIICIATILLSVNDIDAQINGCTDPLAINFNPSAAINDGSCIYNSASVIPSLSFDLDSNLSTTSGLIRWDNQIWTHNDIEDINLYALDTLNGDLIESYPLTGTLNTDWEEISQDADFIYVGDFGNNRSGNRTDLKIYRISKKSVQEDSPVIDTIHFSYSDQKDFTPADYNNTDFDCEAFIVTSDSIYLFTKQWISTKTCIYSLPKTTGTHLAKPQSAYDVNGLITGAVCLDSENLVALCGYSNILEPYIYLLYDFRGSDYFGGNKRKISVSLPYHQIEGIATTDGLKYYITNEEFTQSSYLKIPQKLCLFNLNSYLGKYLESLPTAALSTETEANYTVYPVPAGNFITVIRSNNLQQEDFSLIDFSGRTVLTGRLSESENHIDISSLSGGIYLLKTGIERLESFKVIKR